MTVPIALWPSEIETLIDWALDVIVDCVRERDLEGAVDWARRVVELDALRADEPREQPSEGGSR